MGESYHYNSQQPQKNHQQQARGLSRLGLRTSGGEIVQVQGGHIIRSTSRKDRHSKVCTAKGPRDRRVLLSAHTAIQFYDLQDRLGYDRPSKAVDWLIKKAQTAISKLAELPAWKPTATAGNLTNPNSTSVADFEINPDQLNHFEQHPDDSFVDNPLGNSQRSQDLRLSLQSFQDPVVHNHPHHHSQQTNNNNNNNIYFDGSGWSDNPSVGFQRVVAWGGDGGNNVSAGFVFSSPALAALSPPTPFLQPLFGETITSDLFNNNSQREPLQSSTAPLFRAWIDPLPPFTGVVIDQHPTLDFHRPSSGLGGFSGFGVPARIQGEEEEHDGVSNRPSSTSSDSRR